MTIFGNKYSTKDGTGIRDYIDVEDISQIHIDALRLIKIKKNLIYLIVEIQKVILFTKLFKILRRLQRKNF